MFEILDAIRDRLIPWFGFDFSSITVAFGSSVFIFAVGILTAYRILSATGTVAYRKGGFFPTERETTPGASVGKSRLIKIVEAVGHAFLLAGIALGIASFAAILLHFYGWRDLLRIASVPFVVISALVGAERIYGSTTGRWRVVAVTIFAAVVVSGIWALIAYSPWGEMWASLVKVVSFYLIVAAVFVAGYWIVTTRSGWRRVAWITVFAIVFVFVIQLLISRPLWLYYETAAGVRLLMVAAILAVTRTAWLRIRATSGRLCAAWILALVVSVLGAITIFLSPRSLDETTTWLMRTELAGAVVAFLWIRYEIRRARRMMPQPPKFGDAHPVDETTLQEMGISDER